MYCKIKKIQKNKRTKNKNFINIYKIFGEGDE